MRRIIGPLTVSAALAGCGLFSSDEERVAVARVGDVRLYMDELSRAVPEGLTGDDSTLFADAYIRKWATQELLLRQAELNLPDYQKDVAQQLEDYRRSLLIHKYQQEMARQRMDTIVRASELEEVYQANLKDFALQEDIVRAMFIKVGKDAPELESIKKWMRSDDEELRSLMESYAEQHAQTYHVRTDRWVALDGLLAHFPANHQLSASVLKHYSFAHREDSLSHYFIDIKELKLRNAEAPLPYVEQNVRSIVLNRRKLDMLRQLERDILREAENKRQFEILN